MSNESSLTIFKWSVMVTGLITTIWSLIVASNVENSGYNPTKDELVQLRLTLSRLRAEKNILTKELDKINGLIKTGEAFLPEPEPECE